MGFLIPDFSDLFGLALPRRGAAERRITLLDVGIVTGGVVVPPPPSVTNVLLPWGNDTYPMPCYKHLRAGIRINQNKSGINNNTRNPSYQCLIKDSMQIFIQAM